MLEDSIENSGVFVQNMYDSTMLLSVHHPGDSRSWESLEKEDNVYRLFIQLLFP